jgi:hypothetical protein
MEAKSTADGKTMALLLVILFAVAICGCLGYNDARPLAAVTVGPSATPTPLATVENTPAPTPAVTVLATASPSPDEQWYNENYTWDFKNVEWNFHAQISKSIYEFYKSSPHGQSVNYSSYALTAEDKPFLSDIMKKFKDNGVANGYSNEENAMNVLVFVQSLPYAEDSVEYTRYPLETLKDDVGDCKDKSILAAALLHEMGYEVALLKYPGHMALGISINAQGKYFAQDGVRYYYAETTGPGWEIGTVPEEFRDASPTVIPIHQFA